MRIILCALFGHRPSRDFLASYTQPLQRCARCDGWFERSARWHPGWNTYVNAVSPLDRAPNSGDRQAEAH